MMIAGQSRGGIRGVLMGQTLKTEQKDAKCEGASH